MEIMSKFYKYVHPSEKGLSKNIERKETSKVELLKLLCW